MIVSIGIEPDLKLVERLTFLQKDLGKILVSRGADSRWVRPEFMHLPLLLIGRQDDDDVPEITHIMADTAARVNPFVIGISGIHASPSPTCPRLIQVGVDEGLKDLIDLRDKLYNAFVHANFPGDRREFKPAIQLGRALTPKNRVDITDAVEAIHNLNFGKTSVFEIVLFGADLLDSKPTHSVIARCAFGGKITP